MLMSAVKKAWWLTCFAEQHSEQDWLRQLQLEESKRFLERGLPTRKEERWKYSDVSFLENENYHLPALVNENQCRDLIAAKQAALAGSICIVFVNGYYSASLSDISRLPRGVVLCNMRAALTQHAELIKKYLSPGSASVFANLNMALLTDGIFLHVAANVTISAPLHFLYLNARQSNIVNCPRHLFIMDEASKACMLEEHCSQDADNYFTNIVTDIHTQANAQLKIFKIQNESVNATHFSQVIAQQKKDSALEIFHLALGAKFAREDVFVNLNETGASAAVNGFYFLNNDAQHIDHHIQIDHKAPFGSSEMFYKGILDKKSHGVFNGKIFVQEGAEKTRSQQANHNLLICKDAAIDTKPEFEIYADDVKCAHGAAVGQVDAEALFYLRARGIDAQTAMQMLTYAFAENVMARITEPALLQYMNKLLSEKLNHDS
jgi:Fe-S cluster assembly protein SufD